MTNSFGGIQLFSTAFRTVGKQCIMEGQYDKGGCSPQKTRKQREKKGPESQCSLKATPSVTCHLPMVPPSEDFITVQYLHGLWTFGGQIVINYSRVQGEKKMRYFSE